MNSTLVYKRTAEISLPVVFGAITGMIVLVFVLSNYFGAQSLRLDESQSLWQTSRGPMSILALVAQDVHVPLYHELLRLWRLFVGNTVESARALSLFFFVVAIPSLYLLGRYTYNRTTGLFAALLFSISPFMNWYGNEIRMYTLLTLLAILNHFAFISLMRRGDLRSSVFYALTALAGVYTHYFFFLLLLTQGMFYLLRREHMHPNLLKRLLLSWLFVGAAFIPWGAYVLYSGEAAQQEPALTTPTTLNVFSTFTEFLFGFQDDHVNTVMLSLWPLTVVFGFLALRQMRRPQIETEYFMLSVFAPVLIAFFVSIVVRPVFVSRYLIFTIPALFLLLSSIISLYPRPIRYTARALLIGLMCLALSSELFNPSVPVKENYHDATTYLEQNAKAQDIIVLSAPFTLYPIEYYYKGAAPISTLPIWNQYAHGAIPAFSVDTLPKDVATLTSNHQNVWLLLSYDQGYEKDIQKYFDTHYARIATKEFSPGLTLVGYQIRYDTPVAELYKKSASAKPF